MKPIPGIDGYHATYQGSIYGPRGKRVLRVGNSGYLQLTININGENKTFLAHRLVASAFHGVRPLQVNHKNGDKEDNRPSNLEWVTASDNCAHAYRSGLRLPRGTSNIYHAQSSEGFGLIMFGISDAAKFGFSGSKVSECCKGSRKSHKGFSFQYAN